LQVQSFSGIMRLPDRSMPERKTRHSPCGPRVCEYPGLADEDSLTRTVTPGGRRLERHLVLVSSSVNSESPWVNQESMFMVREQQGKWVVPNPQIPRTFGMLNIVFGALLILFDVSSVLGYFYMPKLFGAFQESIVQQQAARKAEQDARIAELKTKEAAAKSAEEKADFEQERADLERRVAPDLSVMGDFNEMTGMSDRRVLAYYAVTLVTGIILNILMIVAGAGLMRLTEWGRRMGILVAELKIVRWLLITVVSMVLILPISLDRSQKMMAKMNPQGRGTGAPFGFSDAARLGAIVGAVTTIFSAIISSIYPALTIWFLTRPPARAACLRGLKTHARATLTQPGAV
jgi:hypothetical protein